MTETLGVYALAENIIFKHLTKIFFFLYLFLLEYLSPCVDNKHDTDPLH